MHTSYTYTLTLIHICIRYPYFPLYGTGGGFDFRVQDFYFIISSVDSRGPAAGKLQVHCVCMYVYVLENVTTEPHVQYIGADVLRVWLSGYIIFSNSMCICIFPFLFRTLEAMIAGAVLQRNLMCVCIYLQICIFFLHVCM